MLNASTPVARHPRVVASPHNGAPTREAQERISTETAQMVLYTLAGSHAGERRHIGPRSQSARRTSPSRLGTSGKPPGV